MGCSFKRQKKYTNTNAFQKIADEFEGRQPRKIWADKRQ